MVESDYSVSSLSLRDKEREKEKKEIELDNFYTRSSEHLKKASDRKEDSFIHNHQIQSHNGNQPNFSVKVLKSFQDAFSRQVYEGVYIRRNKNNPLNTKLDYYQTSTYNMRREMLHG